jgi:hypothetical protein
MAKIAWMLLVVFVFVSLPAKGSECLSTDLLQELFSGERVRYLPVDTQEIFLKSCVVRNGRWLVTENRKVRFVGERLYELSGSPYRKKAVPVDGMITTPREVEALVVNSRVARLGEPLTIEIWEFLSPVTLLEFRSRGERTVYGRRPKFSWGILLGDRFLLYQPYGSGWEAWSLPPPPDLAEILRFTKLMEDFNKEPPSAW